MSEVKLRLESLKKAVARVEFLMPKSILKRYAAFRVGATDMEKRAYHLGDSVMLTFDDYGNSSQVKQILKVLAENGVKAMFFVQGDWAEKSPELIDQIRKAGHMIGNHTYSHQDLKSLTDEEVREEIRRGPQSKWLRPPRGRYNDRIRQIAAEFGQVICYWDTDSDDWMGVSKDAIVRKVVTEVKPGSVVLLHIHAAHTAEALPEVIAGIRGRGFEVAS